MRKAARPGRSCPLHYRYAPSVFRRPAELKADVLYVVGGLYGNTEALARIVRMAAEESGDARLVFNGDFNWFNIDAESFATINETVLQHAASRGNVETELASDDGTYGCGCGYPEFVPEEVVERSNQISRLLAHTARQFPELRRRLAELPMHLVAQVGGARVAILHGDAESLAGWSFSHEALSDAVDPARLVRYFDEADVRVFACTHTCLPVVKRVTHGDGVIVNNGSAGMPNLRGTHYGLVTRIGTHPAKGASAFGLRTGGVYLDLLQVNYDQTRWVHAFEKNWPSRSPAYLSYFDRITRGPTFTGPISV